MLSYTLNRILQYVIVLAVASVVIFVLVRMSPTDPVAVILGGKQSSDETIANIRHEFYLDKSMPEQYSAWMSGLVRGDFGMSFKYRQEVSGLIASRMPVTLGIVGLAMLISLLVSIPAGILMAAKQHRWQDNLLSVIQLILVACPPFLTSIIMIWYLSVHDPTFAFTGSAQSPGEFLSRISLPALALSFAVIALLSRVMKSGMVEQIHSDYYMVARSKGMSPAAIIMNHCVRNAVIPVITVLGIEVGILLVGSVLVESVFSLSGIGTLLVESVKASDYPLIQGITMLMVFIFMTISTVLDILYGVIDPRIRLK
ncbi:MAG: ABC transporter permease [Clostridiales Family XIII bacterium]|nr:ABC transporter permease [Clostridiales Family XIII bacterium]